MLPPALGVEPKAEITFAKDDKVGFPKVPEVPAGLRRIAPEKLDLRSDEEIGAWLQKRHPVTSDRNIWAFWHSGYSQMAPWVQRNVINWVRKLGPRWTVHLLDTVPGSETNVGHFADSSFFPEAFNNGTMDGPDVGPHSGDLVRLPLLWQYGGVWIDVGTLLFRHVDDICWRQIEDPSSPYEMSGFVIEMRPGVDCMLNGFIAAKRGNPFIKRWHAIYASLWAGGATSARGFHRHPLLRHLPLLRPPVARLNCPDLRLAAEAFSDYLASFRCFERLRGLVDPADGFDGPAYCARSMLLFPALRETYGFQQATGWSGARQLELLAARRDDNADEARRRAAEDLVADALANTATMKLSHGPAGALDSSLADMWDSEAHRHADNAEGTFAAYLRHGSVHFEQTREMRPVTMAWPREEEVLHVGVLEPKEQAEDKDREVVSGQVGRDGSH
ncbi:capsular polysaccharide synthesis protein-domain-containing protein [Xylariaceae sp. FL0804]|nr:capsular polysaccharide synthesis protein-domain-containing protein [Xylariaceae sp. FL0804]